MNCRERVLNACSFKPPGRIPRFDNFWEFPHSWRERLGPPEKLTDLAIWVPEEGTFPSRVRHLKAENGWVYEVDSWGRTRRRRTDAYFAETLQVALPPDVDVATLRFDPPDADSRFLQGEKDLPALAMKLQEARRRHVVFGKTGGPYLRSSFLRGETQFLMDIAGDPQLARSIADKMGDHLTAVGVEAIRRWSLQETGIWIYDDMGSNSGPMFRPESFETVFLPAYRRMIRAYKEAGAKYVFLHSDGNILPLLDMLVDAGIQGLNPLERRAGMDITEIRKRFPHLILAGGMDNTGTLLNGPVEKVQAETREIIELGRDGGVIIGAHSISPEIPLEHFAAYHETCLTYGNFSE